MDTTTVSFLADQDNIMSRFEDETREKLPSVLSWLLLTLIQEEKMQMKYGLLEIQLNNELMNYRNRSKCASGIIRCKYTRNPIYGIQVKYMNIRMEIKKSIQLDMNQ